MRERIYIEIWAFQEVSVINIDNIDNHTNFLGTGVVKKKAKIKMEKKQMKIKDMDLSSPPAIIGQPQVAPAPGKNFFKYKFGQTT